VEEVEVISMFKGRYSLNLRKSKESNNETKEFPQIDLGGPITHRLPQKTHPRR
jgi:hypothetical protein